MSARRVSRREFLRMLAVAAGTTALAGCAPQVVKETVIVEKPVEKVVEKVVTPTAVIAEPVEIVYWVNSKATTVMEKQALILHEKNPNVTVNIVFQGGGSEIIQKFQAALAAGDPPETFFALPYALPPLAEAGAIVDLTPMIQSDSEFDADDIGDVFWEAGTWQGKIMMMPKDFQAWCLFYNTDMFAEAGLQPPTNWEEFEEAAVAVTKDTDGDGNPDVYAIEYMGASNEDFFCFLYNAGGAYVDPENPSVVRFAEPPGHEALELWDRLMNEHKAMPTTDIPSGFQAGKLAMYLSGTWNIKSFLDTQVPFDVIRVPPKERALAHGNMNGYAMGKTDELRMAASWEWLKSLGSAAYEYQAVKENLYVPIHNSLRQNPNIIEWLKDYPQLQYEFDLPGDEFRGWPLTIAGKRGMDILKEAREAALFGQKPLADALNDAAAEVQALM